MCVVEVMDVEAAVVLVVVGAVAAGAGHGFLSLLNSELTETSCQIMLTSLPDVGT